MKTYTDDNPHEHIISSTNQPPWIMTSHIDGPMLCFSDGQIHWLTPWERLLLRYRLTDAGKLQAKRRPNLLKAIQQRLEQPAWRHGAGNGDLGLP